MRTHRTDRPDGVRRLHRFDRWLYPGGRPNRLARLMNRASAALYSTGVVLPSRVAALQVTGRRTGRTISLPVVIADHQDERYLVSMLGEDVSWVRNVRAAGGHAVLRHGRRETVRLEEVEPGARAPILRRYLAVAPGARAHVPVDRRAPCQEFERIAAGFPVFRIVTENRARARRRPVPAWFAVRGSQTDRNLSARDSSDGTTRRNATQ